MSHLVTVEEEKRKFSKHVYMSFYIHMYFDSLPLFNKVLHVLQTREIQFHLL